jgi:gentisate 1,2-dioxygenase
MHITTKAVSSNPVHGQMYSIQHYVIKSVSVLRQVGGIPRVLQFPPPKKTDRQDITEILFKVALNTINPNLKVSHAN